MGHSSCLVALPCIANVLNLTLDLHCAVCIVLRAGEDSVHCRLSSALPCRWALRCIAAEGPAQQRCCRAGGPVQPRALALPHHDALVRQRQLLLAALFRLGVGRMTL